MTHKSEKILRKLRKTFPDPLEFHSDRSPFKTLVATIISQNTTQRNSTKAFERLSDQFPITPKALAEAEKEEIEQSLKVAGLYRNKTKFIKQISKILLEKFQGDLKEIFSMSLEEARKTLMRFPGVGPKTADVLLLFSAEKPTLPIDTHVNRVSKRLGLTPQKAKYEENRKSLQALYSPKDYLAVHVLLILLGRNYCRARKPLCQRCPVKNCCPSRDILEKPN